MSAFFIPKENGRTSIDGGMSVWLAGLDGRVIGVTLHTGFAKEICVNFRKKLFIRA